MDLDLVAISGTVAAVATTISIIIGSGGQLGRLQHCTARQIEGIHVGMWMWNSASHLCWFCFGALSANPYIWVCNALGFLLSAAITTRVLFIRWRDRDAVHLAA